MASRAHVSVTGQSQPDTWNLTVFVAPNAV
jgi:hypothetical protein